MIPEYEPTLKACPHCGNPPHAMPLGGGSYIVHCGVGCKLTVCADSWADVTQEWNEQVLDALDEAP